VEVAEPQKIVLFGSAARGTMGPESDLALLIIKGVDLTAIE
jgi:predicted nucleotidyltransferase